MATRKTPSTPSDSPSGAPRKRAVKKKTDPKPLSKVGEAKAEMYRGLIFEAAEEAFGEQGFGETTMQEIASSTGVSVKTVYASFPGKQELYDAIMLERGRQMYEDVITAHGGEIEPVEKLSAGIRAFIQFFFDHPSWTKMHAISRASWAARPADDGQLELWEKSQAADCKVLREGIEAGIFFDEEPEEVARLIRAMTRVQAMHAFESGGKTAEEVAASVTRRVLRMVCRNPQDASIDR
ncbi:MAG: TetR/AcrR family transcriptional regulator [Myxococcota bacterium]